MAYFCASIFFAGRDWLWPAVILSAIAFLSVGRSYDRTAAPVGLRLACAGLKLAGFAALFACLLEPMWTAERAKPGANVLAIVADNSQSLTLRGPGETETRAETLKRLLTGEKNTWHAALGESFDVRNYLADTRLQGTRKFDELTFDGRSSALGHALRLIAERHRGQPLTGIVLLTDGVAADLSEVSDFAGLPPIYPVVVGRDEAAKDLAIASTATTQTSFEDAPLTVQAEVTATGYRGQEVVGKLTAIEPGKPDAAERVVASQTLRVPAESDRVTFRFQMRPEKVGVIFYRLKVSSGDANLEATPANNETIIAVDRGQGPHRVLYVSGRPNWEYKFLHRAIQGDDQTHLVGLIRIAKREPKFEFRSRAGESSNPLFRGFGNQSKEEVERYDQPVFRRLNTDDHLELQGGFPKTAEELFKYRAIIIDDLEAAFFSVDQMRLVQTFVSERGGSLLMLGGTESFHEGKYQRTPIGDVLPIYLDRGADGPAIDGVRLALTREGWLQPWARLRANEPEEKSRLAALPELEVLNQAGTPKPAAVVVAEVTDGQRQYPALVTQRFGRGRSAALLIGDLWRSGLADEALGKDLSRAWRQMVRWLVADVAERVEIRLEPQPDAQAMLLQVRARDPEYQALDNASVSLTVQPVAPGAAPLTLTAEASANEAGLYEATYVPRETGGYRVAATVKNENGVEVGTAQAGWSTDLAAAEFRSLVPNRALMETLARQTGGEVIAVNDLDAFARDLPARRAPITEMWTRPLWHTPWMFLFALACFVAEWGLRRWKGLA